MRIGVIIAAAGKSTRFGAGDKLSQDLGGRAVLLRTVEAFTKRDRARLASLKAQALEQRDPLAPWVDYWELGNRLVEVRADEVEAFYARWPGSYVEDRLRNDWLELLGERRDWFESPAYRRIAPLRQRSARTRGFFVEGLPVP